MHPNQSKLESRVRRAAEAALSRQKYVSAIDVLCGMGLLATPHVDDWRRGRVDFLERVIQGNLHKISSSMAIFRHWAMEKGLEPCETGYVRHTRGGILALQFSKSGDPEIEKVFPALQRVNVTIIATNGKRFSKQLDYPKGDARNPLSDREVEEKFAALAEGSLTNPQQRRVFDTIWNLEKAPSITTLMEMLKSGKSPAAHG